MMGPLVQVDYPNGKSGFFPPNATEDDVYREYATQEYSERVKNSPVMAATGLILDAVRSPAISQQASEISAIPSWGGADVMGLYPEDLQNMNQVYQQDAQMRAVQRQQNLDRIHRAQEAEEDRKQRLRLEQMRHRNNITAQKLRDQAAADRIKMQDRMADEDERLSMERGEIVEHGGRLYRRHLASDNTIQFEPIELPGAPPMREEYGGLPYIWTDNGYQLAPGAEGMIANRQRMYGRSGGGSGVSSVSPEVGAQVPQYKYMDTLEDGTPVALNEGTGRWEVIPESPELYYRRRAKRQSEYADNLAYDMYALAPSLNYIQAEEYISEYVDENVKAVAERLVPEIMDTYGVSEADAHILAFADPRIGVLDVEIDDDTGAIKNISVVN